MIFNFFSKKAVGFSINDNQKVKAVLICQTQKRLFIEKTEEFDINCKSALHRLQQLLKSYPACLVLPSSFFSIFRAPNGVRAHKDKKEIIKNQVGALVGPDKPSVFGLNFYFKSSAFYACTQKKYLEVIEKKLNARGLSFQKAICSLHALHSMTPQFEKGAIEAALIIQEDVIEWVSCPGGEVHSFLSFNTKGLSPQKIFLKIQHYYFSLFGKKAKKTLILGEKSAHGIEVAELCKTIPLIEVSPSFLKAAPHREGYELEVAAASCLQQLKVPSLTLPSFNDCLKSLKKTLLLHCSLLFAIALTCASFWGFQIRGYKHLNRTALEKNMLQLGCSCSPPANIDELSKQLSLLQKNNPKFLLSPQVVTVSQALMWLTGIAREKTSHLSGSIEFEDFHYQLERSSKAKNSYKTKVTLSFSCPGTSCAKEFCEEIASNSNFVDRSKKVSWNYRLNSYHISFYLTPKPPPSNG